MWSEPITDRTGADGEVYNFTDLNRAQNNLENVLLEVLPAMGYNVNVEQMSELKENDYPFPSVINRLERNLDNIQNSGVYLPVVWQVNYPHWTANREDRIVNFEDMNRWERNPELIYDLFYKQVQKRFRVMGTVKGGQLSYLPRR